MKQETAVTTYEQETVRKDYKKIWKGSWKKVDMSSIKKHNSLVDKVEEIYWKAIKHEI